MLPIVTAESGGFTDNEKGDIAAEKGKLSQTKAAATSQQSPQPTTSPSPVTPTAAPTEKYPLAPSKDLEQQLTMQLVPSAAIGATLSQVPEIKKGFSSSAQKYLAFSPSDTRDPNQITEDDVLKNLSPRTDIFHDVLFVSKQYNWNPDEVLALWENEGLPNWIRATTGTEISSTYGGDTSWRWLTLPSSFKGQSLTDDAKKALARSHILLQYWGLDILASYTYNTTTKDNQLTGSDPKAHDLAFDTGFNNQLSSALSGVTAATLRAAITNDGIEFQEKSLSFRLKPEYQATLLALQHAHYKHVESRVIKASPLQLPGKVTANLTPPFPALIYLYFNSSDPPHSVGLMTSVLKKKQPSYSSKELCDALLTSALPAEVVKSLDVCRAKHSRLNCHGYMNAIRFEFLRRVYEKVFQPTGIGSPRGCPS